MITTPFDCHYTVFGHCHRHTLGGIVVALATIMTASLFFVSFESSYGNLSSAPSGWLLGDNIATELSAKERFFSLGRNWLGCTGQ